MATSHQRINTLLTPVDQHKLDPWSCQIHHHGALPVRHPQGGRGFGEEAALGAQQSPSKPRSKVKIIKEGQDRDTQAENQGNNDEGEAQGRFCQVPAGQFTMRVMLEWRKSSVKLHILWKCCSLLEFCDKEGSAALKRCCWCSSYL